MELIVIIGLIVFITFLNILYIKYKISKPFDYLIHQIKNKENIDVDKLYKNAEFEKVSELYTELRNIQIEIENKNKQLKNENKDFILSSIHQLKTPLSAILMNVELLEMSNLSEDSYEYIKQIKASIDLLNLNSEELVYLNMKGNFDYKSTKIDISKILKSRISFFNQIASVHQKKIICDIEDEIVVDINNIEFERVVDNNISNAIKYSNLDSEINIVLKKEHNQILLSFKSVGKEIEEPSKLFEKGYRESKNKDGYGLGLYIIKSICDKYNINIELKCDNKVTLFTYIVKNNVDVT